MFGLILLPLAVAVSRTAWFLILAMEAQHTYLIPVPAMALMAGFLVWLAVYWFLPRPILSYVLAHELTHALWGSLMGAQVSRFRVSRRGGSVSLSKSNILITLAPYFFPLYAVLIILVYYVLLLFFDLRPYTLIWLGLTGFAWGFHVTFTMQGLWEGQPDIHVYGRVFSYIFIYIFNLLGIALWAVLVSDLALDVFASCFAANAVRAYTACFSLVMQAVKSLG